MALTDVHHVVVRVEDFDASVKNWESIIGKSVDRTDQNDALGIKQAFFDLPGGGFIEIVSPTDPDGAVGKAIAGRGEGIHTLSMSVDSMSQTIDGLKASGVQLIGEGGPQVFIHPKSANGVLVQLSEI